MGKIQISTIAFIFFSVNGYSQANESGIYMNATDFRIHKLAYKINCKTEKHTINLYDYWHKPSITVNHNGKKHVHLKKELFGFQDCDNNVYRFFRDQEYKLEEADSITIYTIERASLPGQGFKKIKDFYFSRHIDSGIFPLDIKNLKTIYSENKKFGALLESTFQNERVSIYDKEHKKYKANYLYDISKNVK